MTETHDKLGEIFLIHLPLPCGLIVIADPAVAVKACWAKRLFPVIWKNVPKKK
jgi:hypothetical protein